MATLQSKAGTTGTFETIAKWSQGEGKPMASKTGTFTGPAIDPARKDDSGALAVLTGYISSVVTNDETAGAFFDSWLYGRDLKAKASLRPAAAADSPWISRDGIRINLGTGERIGKDGAAMPNLALDKVIAFVQRAWDDATDLDLEPGGAVVVGRKMLLESGAAVERNGKIVPAKSK